MDALALSMPDYQSVFLMENHKQGFLINRMKMTIERVIKPEKPG